LKVQEIVDFNALLIKLNTLPFIVSEFIQYKLRNNLSPSSLLEYIRDFVIFFDWMIKDSKIDVTDKININQYHLETLKVDHIREFEEYLRVFAQLMPRTIARKLSALRSLFNYLHDIAENEQGDPLLKRNIFRKISTPKLGDPLTDAREIQDKVLSPSESDEFATYIRTQYRVENASNLQAIWNYEFNCLRDICIINLILSSGLLVSDIVNLNLNDITLQNNEVNISRQRSGYKINHSVFFGESCAVDLNNYLSVREMIYRPKDDEIALFLSIPNGQKIGKRMTKRAIQAMVIKYSTKYGKTNLTTRQLRHSFGIKYQVNTTAIQTKTQLALRNIDSTEKYQILTQIVEFDGRK
jgi:site-specific recombinase XerD